MQDTIIVNNNNSNHTKIGLPWVIRESYTLICKKNVCKWHLDGVRSVTQFVIFLLYSTLSLAEDFLECHITYSIYLLFYYHVTWFPILHPSWPIIPHNNLVPSFVEWIRVYVLVEYVSRTNIYYRARILNWQNTNPDSSDPELEYLWSSC